MHLNRNVLAANKEAHLPTLHDVRHQFAEVAAPFECRENVAYPRALRELRGLHHIEEAVAVDMLDRRIVDLGEKAAGALKHGAHDRSVRQRLREARGGGGELRRALVEHRRVQAARHGRESVLVSPLGERQQRWAHAPIAHHGNQGGEAIGGTHQVNVPELCGGWAHRRGDPRRARGARQGGGGDPEPLVGTPLGLAELVPNHELVDRGHLVGGGDLHGVGAVAEVGWNAARRGVWLHQEAELFELD